MSSCELTEHFLHNTRTHDFDNVTITIIEQIKKDHLETDKKKEVLREREIFWQGTLNSIQPNGLNKELDKVFTQEPLKSFGYINCLKHTL